jgi:ABC-2 type transport system permease protein
MYQSILRIIALTKYYNYSLKTNPLRLFLLITWPLSDLLIWSFTANYIQNTSSYNNFLLPTILCFLSWSILWQSQSETCFPFLQDIYAKSLKNILITPANFVEISLALFIAALSKVIVTILSVALIVFLLFTINVFKINLFMIPYLFNLLLFGLFLGIVSMGLIIRFGPRVDFLTRTLPFYLWPMLCVFYPRSSLPGFFLIGSYLLPPSYIFETIRSSLATNAFDISNLPIIFGLNLLYLILSVLFFRTMLYLSKKNGNLSRI